MRRAYPFCVAISFLFLNLTHQSHAVLEADLVRSSHLIGSSIAHAVENFVEHINLILVKRIFKGDTELVKLIGELGSVNIALPSVIISGSSSTISIFDIAHLLHHVYTIIHEKCFLVKCKEAFSAYQPYSE